MDALAAVALAQNFVSELIPVGVGLHTSAGLNPVTTVGTGRRPVRIARDVSDLQFGWSNYFDSNSPVSDTDGAGDWVIEAAIELGGVVYPVTFAGKRQVTISPGATVYCDPIPADIPRDTDVQVRTFSVSGSYYGSTISQTGGSGGFTTTTNLTATGSAAIPDATNYVQIPSPQHARGRVGSPDRRTLGFWGSSIGQGSGDGVEQRPLINTVNERYGKGGYAGRVALREHIGLVNMACSSDQMLTWKQRTNRLRRMAFASPCSTIIGDGARNDISAGQTLAQLQASVIGEAALAASRGAFYVPTTTTPRTTSTDGWRTLVNQATSGNESVRVAYNQWLRAGAPMTKVNGVWTGADASVYDAARCMTFDKTGAFKRPANGDHPFAATIDTSGAVESSTDSGLWALGNEAKTAADGAGSTGTAFVVTSATIGFTSADVGKAIIVMGAGTAGAPLVTYIKAVSSATAVVILSPIITTVTGATVTVADLPTADGLHPSWLSSNKMADAVPSGAIR